MSVQVRPLGDKDFFAWFGLCEGYSAFTESELTDRKALQLWSWIIDKNNTLDGAVAIDDAGEFVGFAHFRAVPRTLSATMGLDLDDLFALPGSASTGTARALVEFVKAYASEHDLTDVRLRAAADSEPAAKLYDAVATRTDVVTYQIEV